MWKKIPYKLSRSQKWNPGSGYLKGYIAKGANSFTIPSRYEVI